MSAAAHTALAYRHVDVFATAAYRGNGLIVVFCDTLDRPAEQLRRITEEMRQFETIFVVVGPDAGRVEARVFTVEEELPFAGHPVLGAAAAVHERTAPGRARVEWQFAFPDRQLRVVSRSDSAYFTADMDQGRALMSSPLPDSIRHEVGPLLGIEPHDLRDLPLQVVSTGLPYLIVPVTPLGLAHARVARGLEAWLSRLGAKFVYLLDTDAREGRTWDNAGAVEDIATGSAAGPAAAYLLQHRLTSDDGPIRLSQGRFLGRPSTITVTRDRQHHLWVGGPVRPVASGTLESLPSSVPDEAG